MNNDTATLIARQIAVFNGLVWDRLTDKTRITYLTLARSIMATMERTR